MLPKNEFNISIKRTQTLIIELWINSIIIKKYRSTLNKNPKENLEKFLKYNFIKTSINEKFSKNITYIKT